MMMKETCLVIKGRRIYGIEFILFCLAFLIYNFIFNTYEEWLNHRFFDKEIDYMNRVFFITFSLVFTLLIKRRLVRFIRKNWESLILLGYTPLQCFFLFLLTNDEMFLLQLYLGSMFFRVGGIDFATAILVNLLNTFILYLLGMILGIKQHSRILFFGSLATVGLLGIGIGTKKIGFDMVYPFIMSNGVRQLCFSEHMLFIAIKLIFGLYLLYRLICTYKKTGADTIIYGARRKRYNAIGDITHRFRKYPLYPGKYFLLYRSKDFILWKLFSSVLFILVCMTISDAAMIFLIAYGICIISAFYLNDVHNWDVGNRFIYFMSDYPLKKVLLDGVANGMFILGDNVLLILGIACLLRPCYLLIALLILALIILASAFISLRLIMKYPAKQFPLSFLCILMQFHLPVINLYYFYTGLRLGKKNWENLKP